MKHAYSDRFTTLPAIILNVEIAAVGTDRHVQLPGKIDTGADLCVIPATVVGELRLITFGSRRVHAVGHAPYRAPTYLVGIVLESRSFELEVVAHDQPYVLLGRDLMNEWKLIADGPGEYFQLIWPRARRNLPLRR